MLKYIIIALIIILIFASCYEATKVSVQEGEMAQLEFIYPCNSTVVTLQRSNAVPFYNTAYPDVISESNKLVKNRKGNDTCSLNLTINPVSRNDEGTYIPIAYKNGNMLYLQGERRIWLGVAYPPGKASCELARGYVPGEWVKLHCTASKGSLPGQILSFQNGKRLPPLMPPHENDRTVDQTILARIHVADPVYCCSSILSEAKDMCECADWGWDPVLDSSFKNIDPCAVVSTANSLTSSEDNRLNFTTHIPTSLPLKAKATNLAPPQRADFKLYFIIAIALCGLLILIFYIFTVGIQMYQFKIISKLKHKKGSADTGDYKVVPDKLLEDQV